MKETQYLIKYVHCEAIKFLVAHPAIWTMHEIHDWIAMMKLFSMFFKIGPYDMFYTKNEKKGEKFYFFLLFFMGYFW